MLGHKFVVAGYDLDCDPVRGKIGQSLFGALLGRIEECGKTRKDQLRFIAHYGMRMVHPHRREAIPRTRKPSLLSPSNCALIPTKRRFIKGTQVRFSIRLIA